MSFFAAIEGDEDTEFVALLEILGRHVGEDERELPFIVMAVIV